MRRLLLVTSVLIAVAAGSACALTVTVDWTGAGDYLTLPQGMAHAGPADTVLVAPGVYAVGGAGWPIVLTANSASIVGRDGAEVTVLEGTGSETAFRINAGVYDARRCMRGLTFRNLAYLISKPGEDEGGTLTFTDNVVEYCTDGLDASSSGTTAVVARNVFRHSGSMFLYHNNGIVEYNEIDNCAGGMVMHCCEVPKIRHNHIHDSGTAIFTSFSCNIQDNLIEDNSTRGIWLYDRGLVQGNIIRRNGTGIRVVSDHPGGVRNNDICDNGCNIRIGSASPDPWQFDATLNWWGTTDPVEIAATIWDCTDDPSLGICVLFDPWCTNPGCGISAVEPASWGLIKAMFR